MLARQSGRPRAQQQLQDLNSSPAPSTRWSPSTRSQGLFCPSCRWASEKQPLLETVSVRERYTAFLRLLVNVNESINLRIEVARKASEKVGKANREAMLREQLRVIQEELNGGEGSSGDGGYRERIERSTMPDEVRKKAFAELKKLEMGGSQHHESQGIRNYLDLLLDLPWTVEEEEIDIERPAALESNQRPREGQGADHPAPGGELKEEKQGSILLLAGPRAGRRASAKASRTPGPEVRPISLGGVRDEVGIRGTGEPTSGLSGRIIQGMKKAGTKNPVFILDEVDKLAVSHQGDPASALLEVLDPEQNSTFSDHYLEVPYDLSDVLFIATANSLATIPAPLLDRMELVEISGYTKNEKFAIAKDHLLPETLEEHGLDADTLKVEDDALVTIIRRTGKRVSGAQETLRPDRAVRLTKIVRGPLTCPYGRQRCSRRSSKRDGPAGRGPEREPARRRTDFLTPVGGISFLSRRSRGKTR